MKNVFYFLIILCALVPFCFGQDKTPTAENKWTRIETDDKEISVAFPSNFLIDAKTKTRDQRCQLFGFENGVIMEMKISQPDSPKRNLNQITDQFSENAKVSSFKFNGIAGRTFVSKNDRYFNAVHLAFKENLYTLTIRAPNENKAEANRFFCSIKVQGKPLYTCKETFAESNGEAVLLSSLETSPKVLEALNREPEGKEGKIIYELETVDKDAMDKDSSKRPAIILYREFPKPRALRIGGNIIRGAFKVKLRATLLANGQVGDITVFSNLSKDYIKNFVDAVRKSRFIPAEIDGKPVDSQYGFVYGVETR